MSSRSMATYVDAGEEYARMYIVHNPQRLVKWHLHSSRLPMGVRLDESMVSRGDQESLDKPRDARASAESGVMID